MGTRSLTVVADFGGEYVVMYRQMDGYPSGHGMELWNAFKDFRLCNGISFNSDNSHYANGLGCLAAQVVAHFKTGIGNIYLYPSGMRDVGEEWIYYIYSRDDRPETIFMRVIECDERMFYDGELSLFEQFLASKKGLDR